MKQDKGFSLLELSIATAITVVLSTMCLMGILATASTTKVIERESDCAGEMRSVMGQMSKELQLAATEANTKVNPVVAPITVVSNATTGLLDSIVFQIPVTPSTSTWSTPITYRYVNEDKNGNAMLDDGEDTDGDGRLSRRLIRRQTVGGEVEEALLGSANNLSSVRVAVVSTVKQRPVRLDVTIEASRNLEAGHGSTDAITRDQASATIQLAN